MKAYTSDEFISPRVKEWQEGRRLLLRGMQQGYYMGEFRRSMGHCPVPVLLRPDSGFEERERRFKESLNESEQSWDEWHYEPARRADGTGDEVYCLLPGNYTRLPTPPLFSGWQPLWLADGVARLDLEDD